MTHVQGTTFSIHDEGLKLDSSQDIEPYLAELRAHPKVEEVKFGGNTLGVGASEALASVLGTLSALRTADFADVFTGRLIDEIPKALLALCTALSKLPNLVEVDLSDNAFGGRCADAMVPLLSNAHNGLQTIRLSNNGLGPIGGNIVADALLESGKRAKASGKPSSLRTFFYGRNRMEEGSAAAFSEVFEAHGTFTVVRLGNNGIPPKGIALLLPGLAKCRDLQYLDLQDNTLTVTGAEALAKCLPSWPDLRVLNLSDTLLKPKGGIAIATALNEGANTRMEELYFHYSEIDTRAISILAKAILSHMPHLDSLDLNGNYADPDDDCIEEVRAALEAHGHADALGELDEMQ